MQKQRWKTLAPKAELIDKDHGCLELLERSPFSLPNITRSRSFEAALIRSQVKFSALIVDMNAEHRLTFNPTDFSSDRDLFVTIQDTKADLHMTLYTEPLQGYPGIKRFPAVLFLTVSLAATTAILQAFSGIQQKVSSRAAMLSCQTLSSTSRSSWTWTSPSLGLHSKSLLG